MCIAPGRGEPVIKPKMIVGGSCGDVPGDAVIVFSRYALNQLRRLLADVEEVESRVQSLESYVGSYGGRRIAVFRTCIGAPAAVLTLETAVFCGVKRVIVVGYAGSLSSEAEIGDVLLPTWGIREEGTSFHYYPPDYIPRPSAELVDRLYEAIKRLMWGRRFRVVKGGVWSTDAVFRETRDKVEEYDRRGVVEVDMESTALMAVAAYRGVDLAIALIITDEIRGERWIDAARDEKLKRRFRRIERIVLRAALEVLTA